MVIYVPVSGGFRVGLWWFGDGLVPVWDNLGWFRVGLGFRQVLFRVEFVWFRNSLV